jgi:hypothetical protein
MTLTDKFNQYHRDNPQVYELFKYFTLRAIKRGHNRLSAWMIANRIRWETSIETFSVDEYKISNDYIALYARMFMRDHPEYDGFFKTKEMKRA